MKLVKDNDSTLVRILKPFIIGAIIGATIGGITGYFKLERLVAGIKTLDITNEITLVSLILGILMLLVATFFMYKVKQLFKEYKINEDDDSSEELYRNVEKNHSYASIFVAMAMIAIFINFSLGFKPVLEPNFTGLRFQIISFGLLFLVLFYQIWLVKWHNKLRGTKAPLVPTLKELKNNVLGMDEAELQANYKTSFEIIMTLKGVIIPGLFLLIMLQTFLVGQANLTALLSVGFIQFYIIIMQFKMVKEFYK